METEGGSTVIYVAPPKGAPCGVCPCRSMYDVVELDKCKHKCHQQSLCNWFCAEECCTLLGVQPEVDAYIKPANNNKNVVAVVGGPGTGKRTLCQMALLYALCKGFNGVITGMVADRAKQPGGIHLRHLGCVKQSDSNFTPGHLAGK